MGGFSSDPEPSWMINHIFFLNHLRVLNWTSVLPVGRKLFLSVSLCWDSCLLHPLQLCYRVTSVASKSCLQVVWTGSWLWEDGLLPWCLVSINTSCTQLFPHPLPQLSQWRYAPSPGDGVPLPPSRRPSGPQGCCRLEGVAGWLCKSCSICYKPWKRI